MRFEVPMVEINSWVTIELSVQGSDGTVLWYGKDTLQVKDGGNLNVNIARQYWTLAPGCIAISATSYSLLYNASTWTSDSTELSVTGLDTAPAGSTFSYEWKDEGGNVVGTDPTLTQTVFELYGSPAGAGSLPYGDITKTITVTVSYTDASGATVTADASADIALGGPVVLPTFSMHAAPPANPAGYDAANSNISAATPEFALTSLSSGIVITADAGGAEFPAGTRFSLTINGTVFPTQDSPSWTVSLADLGYTAATATALASPANLSITCVASNTRAQVTETGSGSAKVCLLYTIPSFTITLAPPAAPSYVAAKSDTAAKKYALADLDGSFSFTPVPAVGTSFPEGTTFTWTVVVGSDSPATLSPDTGVGESCTRSLAALGLTAATIGRTSAAATGISVSCIARNDHAASNRSADSDAAASAFLLQTIPAFKIDILPPTSHNSDNSDAATNTYALTSLTDGFTLNLSPAVLSGPVPVLTVPLDTTFEWKLNGTVIDGVTGTVCTLLPSALGMTSSSPGTAALPKSVTINCTAKGPNAVADVSAPEETVYAFRLAIPSYKITVTAPDGIETETSGTDTVYLVSIIELDNAGKKFTLKAEPVNSGDSFPDGTEFSWKFGAAAWTTADDDDDEMQVTVKTMCGGITSVPAAATGYTVQCEASLTDAVTPAVYPATTTVKVKNNPVLTVAADDFATVLASLDDNTTADADLYKIKITGLDESNLADIKTALKDSANSSKYVDLSPTTLPSVTSLYQAFEGCATLVKAPVLPDGVADLSYCFAGCTKLREAPVLPVGVQWINNCFFYCTSLQTAPVIPESVTQMEGCFKNCTILHGRVVIKASLASESAVEQAFYDVNSAQITLYVRGNSVAHDLRDAAFEVGNKPLLSEIQIGPPWPDPGE